jgi:hypothetical protein
MSNLRIIYYNGLYPCRNQGYIVAGLIVRWRLVSWLAVRDENTRSFLSLSHNIYKNQYFFTHPRTNIFWRLYICPLFDIGSDYLPPLSVPDFVLTSVRRSRARYAAAAFPATIFTYINSLATDSFLLYNIYMSLF